MNFCYSGRLTRHFLSRWEKLNMGSSCQELKQILLILCFQIVFFAVMNEALVFYPAHRNRTNASTESTCWRYCLVRQRFQNGKRDECISLFLYISLCLSFAHLCTIQLYKRRKYFGREDFLSTGHIPVLFENRRWCPIL